MRKPLNTQNEWIILTLMGAVSGFCLVSLDVKENTQTWFKSWEVIHFDLEWERDSTFGGGY